MNRNKKYLCIIGSAALIAASISLAVFTSTSKSLSKNSASKSSYLDITAEQLEQAMNGDGSLTVGSYDTWKVENVAFFTENGDRYAKLDSTSAIYSTSTAGEESMGGLQGTGYTAVTIFNKKSTSSSYVYLLQDNGDTIYGSKGSVEIASGESDSYLVELLTPYAKRIKFSGVASGDNSLSFTSLRLNFNCEVSEGIRYENDGVYYWKRNLATDALSDKKFILWDEGEVVDGFRTDMSSDGKVMRNVSVWDGTSKSTSLSGTGSEADPYLINSAADLAYFADSASGGNNYSSKFIRLEVSVDLNNNPLTIGGFNSNVSFAGTFEGNNQFILGNKLTAENGANGSGNCIGLFPTLANTGAVKDLAVDGTVSGTTNIGGLIGISNSPAVENCYNFATVSATGNIVGGIAGNTFHAGAVFTECYNFGAVGSTSTDEHMDIGGIVGRLIARVENSENYGTMTAAKYVGGVVGEIVNGTVSASYNFGEIKATSTAGGVVGDGYGTITNCKNYADVTATGGYAGGILGTQRSGAVTVSDCTNEGVVNCGSGSYAGGIIGALVTKAQNVVSDCTNSGNITGGQRVGGIVGSNASWVADAKVAFTNCTNSGTIKGSDYVGGIAGFANGTYSTCTNTGTITCPGTHNGDLFGGGTITEA